MATSVPRVSDNPVVQEHYGAQLGLTAALSKAAERLTQSPDYLQALAALTQEFQTAAVSMAADYYTALREHADVPGSFSPPVIDPWRADDITAYMRATVDDLVGQADRAAEAVAAGQNITLNAGTDELFAAVQADPKRPRWARVTRPNACAFCLMLATRGARYRTQTTASFRPHRKCQCDVEVSFTSYEPPAHVRAAQQLYSESTAEARGSKDKQNAFRRALYAQRSSTR